MKEIEQYKNADKEISALFNGLPNESASLVKSLITIAIEESTWKF